MESVNRVSFVVPKDFDAKIIPDNLSPVDSARIIKYGVELFQCGENATLQSRDAELASLQADFQARERRLSKQLETEREAARQERDTIAAEAKRAARTASDMATASSAALIESLRKELREARAESTTRVHEMEKAHADFFIETARRAREDADVAAKSRIEAAESEYHKRVEIAEHDYQRRVAELEREVGTLRNAEKVVSALGEKFDRVFSSHGANSASKGRLGEQAMTTIIAAQFPDAEFSDCSKSAGKGDATLVLNRGGRDIKIMVESKSMEQVQARDIAKFARDCKNREDIHAALFLSLTSETIPRLGPLAFRVEAGRVPTLYLAGIVANPERLRVGIESLIFAVLTQPATSPSSSDTSTADTATVTPGPPPEAWQDVSDAIQQAFATLSKQAGRTRALRDSIGSMLETLTAMENEATIYLAAVTALWARRPTLKPATTIVSPVPTLAHTTAITPTTTPSPVVQPITPFLASAAPSDPEAAVYFKLRRFIAETGRDPTATEAMASGISAHYLRKFGGLREAIKKANALAI